jgi:F420-non-reducing hydrogenase iron-sulfur subunit
MCTGRVDLSFILRALQNGKDGVFIGGCWPGECHYITEGNYLAFSTLHLGRKLLQMIGVSPERLRLEWISASEGSRYADVMNDFSMKLKEMGPIGNAEEMKPNQLKYKLEALQSMVPYIKLVERERFRVPIKSVQAYTEFFNSDEFALLFKELIADKYELCQIMALLNEKPYSKEELSEMLGINSNEVSNRLNRSARQGFVEFDEDRKRYIPV